MLEKGNVLTWLLTNGLHFPTDFVDCRIGTGDSGSGDMLVMIGRSTSTIFQLQTPLSWVQKKTLFVLLYIVVFFLLVVPFSWQRVWRHAARSVNHFRDLKLECLGYQLKSVRIKAELCGYRLQLSKVYSARNSDPSSFCSIYGPDSVDLLSIYRSADTHYYRPKMINNSSFRQVDSFVGHLRTIETR